MADVDLSTLGSVIKTAYEGETNTNAFTDAEQTKLSNLSENAIDGVAAQEEGATVVTASTFNFVGGNVTVTDVAGVATITITGGSGGSTIITQEEGLQVDAAATTLNFVGAGVTASDAGSGVTTVTIPGGGSGSAIEVEDEGVSLTTGVTKLNFVGDGVTATEPVADEVTITIPGGGSSNAFFSGARVNMDTTPGNVTGTMLSLDWSDEVYDTEGYFSAVNPDRFTIPRDGYYRLVGSLDSASTDSDIFIALSLAQDDITSPNLLALNSIRGNAGGSGSRAGQVVFEGFFSSGTEIYLNAQTSPAVIVALDTVSTWFSIQRISIDADEIGGSSGSGSPVPVQDNGSEIVAAPTALNFIGAGVTVTDTVGVATIDIPASGGGGSTVITQDEGAQVDAVATTLNFVGDGVTAADAGSNVTTITIPGSGATVITQDDGVEVDATASTLNFTGAGVTTTDSGSGVTEVNIPTAVVSDFVNNWSVPWRGATASLTADDTATNLSSFTIYAWDTVSGDTDSFWSAGNPSRMTIPASSGITKIRLHGFVDVGTDLNDNDSIFKSFLKNGSTSFIGTANVGTDVGFNNQVTSLSSGVIDVVEGDYFELAVQMATVTNATVLSARSYFQIEVVEVSNATSRVFDIPVFISGQPTSSQVVVSQVLNRPATLLAGGGQSQAYADTTATAAATFNITQNGSNVGNVDFAIGSNTGTFTVASDVSFVAGDRVAIVAPASVDATLADINITLDLNLF